MPTAAPRLLVSVRNADEALAALHGGADIIDIKEPAAGALGMASAATIADICHALAPHRVPVSAALGELATMSDAGVAGTAGLPLAFAKLGLAAAPRDWRERAGRVFAGLPRVRPIAAAYADHALAGAPSVSDVLEWAQSSGAAGLLIDTFTKDGRSLFDFQPPAEVVSLIERARAAGLMTALAGSLRGDSFEAAAELGADIIAVRGAACDGNDRSSRVVASRVHALAATLRRARV